MVSAHRNPVVGAEQASRAERLLSAEVGASVLDRGQGLDDEGQGPGQRQGSGEGWEAGRGGDDSSASIVTGQGQGQGPGQGQRQEGEGGGVGQLMDKSAIDLALARAGVKLTNLA